MVRAAWKPPQPLPLCLPLPLPRPQPQPLPWPSPCLGPCPCLGPRPSPYPLHQPLPRPQPQLQPQPQPQPRPRLVCSVRSPAELPFSRAVSCEDGFFRQKLSSDLSSHMSPQHVDPATRSAAPPLWPPGQEQRPRVLRAAAAPRPWAGGSRQRFSKGAGR